MAIKSGGIAWKRKEIGGLFIILAMALVSVALVNYIKPGTGQTSAEKSLADECVAGVADGEVTVDGRPLLWKLRNEMDEMNDLNYFVSGIEYSSGLGPTKYSFLGMGPPKDSAYGSVRQGLNSQGLAVGWNVLDYGGWQLLNYKALGYFNSGDQVRVYLNNMTDLSTHNYFIDVEGEAVLWESQTGDGQHWEYDTRAPARDNQWIDGDNADGDGNYATGTDVTLSGWVVRANAPGHFNDDGSDDLWNTDRYNVGRDVLGSLVYNNGNGTALSAKNLAVNFFRHDSLAINNTVSNMIVQGVLPNEDPRLSTMWVLLGHTETGIFVPVWIHGVESGGVNKVPQYLNSSDNICVYTPAKGMHNGDYNEPNVQARTLPFEGHLFDVVNDLLLPDWRSRNWSDDSIVNVIGEEMKRVQEQMDADAYKLLKYLYDHDSSSNYSPTVSIDDVSRNGLEATFSVIAHDADGDDLTYQFNYGDGQINANATHTYAQNGHYLVSCTVTDEHGISQTDWIFVTVHAVAPPAAFNKSAPSDGATGQSTSPVLSWASSSGATSYEYCYDTSNDNTCSNWTSNGTDTSKLLSGLSSATTYFWHVRAKNDDGIIYANGSSTSFWRFTTATDPPVLDPPASFNKSAPIDGETGQSTSPVLSWATSSGATSYEYCYDTSINNACDNWTSNGTNTSKNLTELNTETTYYWHVRAINNDGTTYSNDSDTTYWRFTTAVALPDTSFIYLPLIIK